MVDPAVACQYLQVDITRLTKGRHDEFLRTEIIETFAYASGFYLSEGAYHGFLNGNDYLGQKVFTKPLQRFPILNVNDFLPSRHVHYSAFP